MAKRSISIYDIAQLAGVSTATVSNVLNQKGSFSDKTRDRVLAIAQREGYVANFAAKSLREASTKTVALITPDVSNDFFSTLVLDVEGGLREAGYTSYVCNTANDADRETAYVRDLISKQVDGIVYIGGAAGSPTEAAVDLPVVHIDHTGSAGVDREVFVGNDMHAVVGDMTATLLRHGCQRIACVSVSATRYHEASDDLMRGYRDCLALNGLAADEALVLQGAHHEKSYVEAERLVGDYLDRKGSLDGIVALGDRVALGAVRALVDRGISVGDQVRVIGMDDSIYSRVSTPAISTVRRNTAQMAETAVQALLAMMAGDKPAESMVAIPHEVIERTSTLGS